MLNIIFNILVGYIFESIYFVYAYNKIKGENHKNNYFIFMFSYIFSSILIKFLYNNINIAYILISFIFCVLSSKINKNKFMITDFFILLNLILSSSLILAIPIIFIGYNYIYLITNIIINILLFILFIKIPFNKLYKKIIPNWNRTENNNIKSVTLRNFTLIITFIGITIINIFLNNYFMDIFQKLL